MTTAFRALHRYAYLLTYLLTYLPTGHSLWPVVGCGTYWEPHFVRWKSYTRLGIWWRHKNVAYMRLWHVVSVVFRHRVYEQFTCLLTGIQRDTYSPSSGSADTVRRARCAVGLFSGTASPVLHRDVDAQPRRALEVRAVEASRCQSHKTDSYRISGVLGWVTPGAATDGVTPLFFPEKPGDLFCSSLYRFLLLSLGCHPPPRGCHPTPFFNLSDLVSPLFL